MTSNDGDPNGHALPTNRTWQSAACEARRLHCLVRWQVTSFFRPRRRSLAAVQRSEVQESFTRRFPQAAGWWRCRNRARKGLLKPLTREPLGKPLARRLPAPMLAGTSGEPSTKRPAETATKTAAQESFTRGLPNRPRGKCRNRPRGGLRKPRPRRQRRSRSREASRTARAGSAETAREEACGGRSRGKPPGKPCKARPPETAVREPPGNRRREDLRKPRARRSTWKRAGEWLFWELPDARDAS